MKPKIENILISWSLYPFVLIKNNIDIEISNIFYGQSSLLMENDTFLLILLLNVLEEKILLKQSFISLFMKNNNLILISFCMKHTRHNIFALGKSNNSFSPQKTHKIGYRITMLADIHTIFIHIYITSSSWKGLFDLQGANTMLMYFSFEMILIIESDSFSINYYTIL